MGSSAIGLSCQKCQKIIPESEFQLVCPDCGDPLDVRFDLDKVKAALSRMEPGFTSKSLLSPDETKGMTDILAPGLGNGLSHINSPVYDKE